jgi:hypothetical protein
MYALIKKEYSQTVIGKEYTIQTLIGSVAIKLREPFQDERRINLFIDPKKF